MDERSIANSLRAVSDKLGILPLLFSVGGIAAARPAKQIDLVYLVCLVWSVQTISCVWFNETNQMNQTDQIDRTDQMNRPRSRFATRSPRA
jgi:hypothetical protein